MTDKLTKLPYSRPHLIVANAFLMTAKLFYYKNSSLSTVKELKELTFLENLRLREKFETLHRAYSREFSMEKGVLKRKPILALYFNLLGLDEVISSRGAVPDFLERLLNQQYSNCRNFLIGSFVANELFEFYKKNDERLTGYHYRYIASFLSGIGDCLFSMCKLNSNDEKELIKIPVAEIFDLMKIKQYASTVSFWDSFVIETPIKKSPSIIDVIKCYYLSGVYYQKASREISFSFQLRKILNVLRVCLKKENYLGENCKYIIDFLEKELQRPILNAVSVSVGNTDYHEKRKALGKLMDYIQGSKELEEYVDRNLSNHPDVREAHLLIEYIRLQLTKSSPNFTCKLVSPFNVTASQFLRILELDIHSKSLMSWVPGAEIDNLQKYFEYFFNQLSILRILKIYGSDYHIGVNYIGHIHLNIAKKLNCVEKDYPQFTNMIKANLDRLLGTGSYSSLDIQFHFKKAIKYYSKAKELHTVGKEYRNMMSGMLYLEDDFNDNGYHFGAAIDRFMHINGEFDKIIEECETELNKMELKKSE